MTFSLLLLALSAHAEVPAIPLEEALARSAATPSVGAASDGGDVAAAQLASARAARLPSINVSGNVLVYQDEQVLNLFATDEPIDCTGIPDPFGALCAGFSEPTVVRDQVTSSLTVRAVVPLTGQVAIDRRVAAAREGLYASDASQDAAVADARYGAADAWFSALQVEGQLAVATAQVEGLEARVATAQASFEAGTLTRNDLLLTQLSLSQARQAALQLTAARDAAYGRLGLAIGNGGEPVRPEAPPDRAPRPVPDVEALVQRALSGRPDLVSMRHRVEAADASAEAASWGRLPSISAMGVYQHQEGQGLFGEPDIFYAGATLDWNLWAWGSARDGLRAARATTSQVQHQVDAAEAGARLEVRVRANGLSTATAALQIAEGSLAQAEENRMIVDARHNAGISTMAELLDADLALVRAQSGLVSARVEAWRAEAALERAVGADPWGS